jgi:ribosome-interacting GTPase 1
MLLSPVVILVGGPNTGKTKLYTEFTASAYHHPTTQSTPNITMWITPSFVLVDTPGNQARRNPQEYSWQGIFRYADVILDFGNWSETEINGVKSGSAKYMTWSGDNAETIKRVHEYLQGR